MSTRFTIELRGFAGIEVVATIHSMQPPSFSFQLYSPGGHPMDWDLTRAELAMLARAAAQASAPQVH